MHTIYNALLCVIILFSVQAIDNFHFFLNTNQSDSFMDKLL